MAVHTCVQDLDGASKETQWAAQSANEHSLLPARIRWLTNLCSSNSREPEHLLASLDIYKHEVRIHSHRHTCM